MAICCSLRAGLYDLPPAVRRESKFNVLQSLSNVVPTVDNVPFSWIVCCPASPVAILFCISPSPDRILLSSTTAAVSSSICNVSVSMLAEDVMHLLVCVLVGWH